jgi:uncharacterized protein (TIGR00251 family)
MGPLRNEQEPEVIQVKVQTRARKPGVEQLGPAAFRVKVTVPPVKGEANREACRLLAVHFGVPCSSIRIVKGWTSSHKLIAVTHPRS